VWRPDRNALRRAAQLAPVKAWVVHVACSKPNDLGYAAEVWSRQAVARHVREPAVERLVSHSDPNQMMRLVFALQPPHLAEEKQFVRDVQTKGNPFSSLPHTGAMDRALRAGGGIGAGSG
jgi:hypothetical protein